MMNTPICDFVREYAQRNALRLHMPGHKGNGFFGVEQLDITEIPGADSLYEADGIICESERNASRLFGAQTFYSTEGSSLCIRAMLYLALLHGKSQGRAARILAGRNAHKTFMSAVALLGLDVEWLYGSETDSYLSCALDASELDCKLSRSSEVPCAVYITSPDYLGNMADVRSISAVCHRYDVPLLVDCAHGAYLKFMAESFYPIDLGADMCCASAHKTLPSLTGGAYLHVAWNAPKLFSDQARNALGLFGSTSPSYLILQSLDAVNRYIEENYAKKLADFSAQMKDLRDDLTEYGFELCGDEPMKLTIATKPFGYTGLELAEVLSTKGIEAEFADPDFIVFMFTPEIRAESMNEFGRALLSIPCRPAIVDAVPALGRRKTVMQVREAMLSPNKRLPVRQCKGRVLAMPSIGCPPAVPIAVCGEEIDESAMRCFEYYGIEHIYVVSEAESL